MCHDNTGGCSNSRHGKHDKIDHINTHTCINTATTTTSTSRSRSNQGDLREDYTSSNNNNSNNKNWVRNFSKIPLTDAQQHLLSHGPNFVIVPRKPPTREYIAATEKVCQQLTQGKAEELRGEIKSLLKRDHKIKANIPRDEHQVLRKIKRDNTRMVITTDKGVSMVVMDRKEYTAKSESYSINQLQDPQNRSHK